MTLSHSAILVDKTMQITLNGKTQEFTSPVNLYTIVQRFAPNQPNIIVEHNDHIIKRHEWRMKTVNEGDVIELVNVVGGG